ncbi:MAG: hypothetical protein ACE5HJ_08790 [Thermoplasmata archaeon]
MKLPEAVKQGWTRLRDILSSRRMRRVALLSGLAYSFIYLFTIGHLVISPGSTPFPGEGLISLVSLDNLWKERAPYNFEPIAVFHPFQGFAIFLAVPNLLLAGFLGLLLGLNISASVHAYTQAKACGLGKSFSGIAASVPAFLTGFACCAPTFIILLGTAFAAGFVVLLQWFMPAALGALVLALAWNLLRHLPSVSV